MKPQLWYSIKALKTGGNMAKEFTVAEFGHEERKDLGKRVGFSKNRQINSQTKLSKNEVYVAEIEQKQDKSKVSVSIKIKKDYKEFVPEKKRTQKSKADGRRKNQLNKAQKSAQANTFKEEELARDMFAERKFPSIKQELSCNALVID